MTGGPTEGRFLGKSATAKPACPFCGMWIGRPDPVPSKEMPIGICSCGAVYACDVTGHNLGSAMVEALVHACHGDWDGAWDLTPDQDYLDKQIKNYDLETHQVIPGGVFEGRRISGVLYFIRLNKPMAQTALPESVQPPDSFPTRISSFKLQKRSFTKLEVEALVKHYDLAPLLQMAEQDNRIIRDLKRLLYSADRLLRWRAAEALGKASAVIAQKDPTVIPKLVQGLFSSISDTAASSWGSIDAIGEIICCLPDHFSRFIPQLAQLTRDSSLLPEVLRAMAKVAETQSDLLRRFSDSLIPLLHYPHAEVRGYAAILLGHLRSSEAKDDLLTLQRDEDEMEIYCNGELQKTTIGQIAAQSLSRL